MSNNIPVPGKSLADLYPRLAEQWNRRLNEVEPNEVKPYSNMTAWWTCPTCKHTWQAKIANRVVKHSGCPKCPKPKKAKKKAVPKTMLAGMCPEIAEEWDREHNADADPETTRLRSDKPVHWICSNCGHKWEDSPHNRVRTPACPHCGHIPQLQ